MKALKIIILLTLGLVFIYSIGFEPYRLESTFHEVTIGTGDKSLLIAHVTDLHTKGLGSLELKLIETINSKRPEIILITGDIATPGGTITGSSDDT